MARNAHMKEKQADTKELICNPFVLSPFVYISNRAPEKREKPIEYG